MYYQGLLFTSIEIVVSSVHSNRDTVQAKVEESSNHKLILKLPPQVYYIRTSHTLHSSIITYKPVQMLEVRKCLEYMLPHETRYDRL